MTLNYNKKLSKLATNSSLAQSAIPVIVCDEKLLICMISYGARKLCFPMQLGKNMLPLFPKNIQQQLIDTNSDVLITELVRGYDCSTALIVTDTVNSEKYHAIVILPQIMFSNASIPWYIDSAFVNLKAAIYELISSQRIDTPRLDVCCTRLSTLFSFLREPYASVVSSRYASPNIYRQLNIVVNETAAAFASIKCTLTAEYSEDVSFTTPTHPRYVTILSTTLLSLLILSSADASVCFRTDITKGEKGTLTFSHSIVTELVKDSPIDDIDTLRHRLVYLAPELAAIQDLAKRLNIPLSCKTNGDEFTVTYSIPICTVGAVTFHESDIDESVRVRNLVLALISDFTYNEKTQKIHKKHPMT